MNKVLVSVIIPVYNTEKYLEELIQSLMNQSLQEMEFLFINDGSTDHSREILEHYAGKDRRICVINQKNAGVSTARNTGLDIARGEYIGFVDADDTVAFDMYERLYHTALQHQADIVSCGYCLKADTFQSAALCDYTGILDQKSALADILDNKHLGMAVWNKLFRSEVLQQCRFTPKYRINEDRLFLFNAVEHANRIVVIQDTLYHYRVNLDSASHSFFSEKKMDGIWVAKEMERITQSKYPEMTDLAYSSVARVLLLTLEMIYEDNAMTEAQEEFRYVKRALQEIKLSRIYPYVRKKRFIQMAAVKCCEPLYRVIKSGWIKKFKGNQKSEEN